MACLAVVADGMVVDLAGRVVGQRGGVNVAVVQRFQPPAAGVADVGGLAIAAADGADPAERVVAVTHQRAAAVFQDAGQGIGIVVVIGDVEAIGMGQPLAPAGRVIQVTQAAAVLHGGAEPAERIVAERDTGAAHAISRGSAQTVVGEDQCRLARDVGAGAQGVARKERSGFRGVWYGPFRIPEKESRIMPVARTGLRLLPHAFGSPKPLRGFGATRAHPLS